MERIEKLKLMLAQQPGDSFLQHALALEYIKAGDEGQARFLFEKILKADENYIGSYYHLAGLLERMGETAGAIHWYKKGMQKASDAGDRHAYNELRAAYEEIADDES
jgi:Tfp pilus assembly protein PilF